MRHSANGFLVATLIAALAMLLGACASRTGTGAAFGGGAGALTGAAIGGGQGALIGGLLGAAVGAGIGYGLDRRDRRRAAYVLETAPTYQTQAWVNPDTGARYRMTPVETFRSQAGAPCREFTLYADIGGRPQETWGTACRQPDGSWRIVDTG